MTSEHSRIAKFMDDSYNLRRWLDLPKCLARACKHEKFQIVGHSKVTCMQGYAGTTIDELCIWRKRRGA